MSRLATSTVISVLACGLSYAQPGRRITRPVDSQRLTHLNRTTHPAIRRSTDLGRASADLPMDRMLMQLQSSPEQQAELEQLIAAQHDPASAEFQRWLTPVDFGLRFGPSQHDIDAVVHWLESNGFQVDRVAPGNRVIEFSGMAGQVETAFHTEMHEYELNGERHVANATDIAIPEALAPVVGGLASLHTFRREPMHHVLTALANGAQGLSPWDFAAIYNVKPLWNLGFDGTGQSVAIAGRTNIKSSDVATFRSMFGLPAGTPQVILNGTDPGIVSAGEEFEADLDVEWSGAVAKGAAVKFVVSKSTYASDGVDLSIQYIVTQNLAPAMSVSFGQCEAALGPANAFYNSMFQQAAAQGISVFVSSGDSGSAGCDSATSATASRGLAVNGLGSTPYNVSVGGTQFADAGVMSTYWNSANDAHTASAKSYIPEAAWNESASGNLYAGGGGVSQVYAAPAWQTGKGVPAGDPAGASEHHRYLPDVSLTAAGHDGYLVVRQGSLYMLGGTSAASPAFAGLATILAQYTGGRNGNLNTRLYALAGQNPAVFHDVAAGTIAVPCVGGSPNCSSTTAGKNGALTGYAAGPGYDLATGLGSVDAYAMALNWGARAPAVAGPSITSLTPNPMTASASAQTLTINSANFAAGATVQATYSGGSPVSLAVTSFNSTRVTVSIATGLVTRAWNIVVTNPNGQSSAPAVIQVNAPAVAPAISSLTPNPLTGSNNAQILTINGSNFQAGANLDVSLSYAGGRTVTLAAPQVTFVNTGQILAMATVGTAVRAWSVTVTNPNGQTSAPVTLNVTAPPSPPVITSLSPNPMQRSASAQTLTINGTGFVPGPNLRVVATYGNTSSTVLQGASIAIASSTRITLPINVGTVARTWTIQVINAEGTASAKVSLSVN